MTFLRKLAITTALAIALVACAQTPEQPAKPPAGGSELRSPVGEWICLQSRNAFGGNGCGLAESALYDETGLIGRATQSLAIRLREHGKDT